MLYVKMLVILCSLCMILAGCTKTEVTGNVPVQSVETHPVAEQALDAVLEPTEIAEPEEAYTPSNSTDFDRQWMLGCKTMGWKFGDWMFKLGGVEATPQGMKLMYLGMESPDFARLTLGSERYLEIWDGSQWKALSQFTGHSSTIFEGTVENGTEVMTEESWEPPLAPGYYRLGAYYTATMASGDSCRQLCYAKFRIVDENTEELVKLCQEGLNALLNQETFHIFRTDYMLQQRDREEPHYFTQEVFRSGRDYYKDYRYYFYSDNSEKGAQAELYRNGEGQNWNSSEDPSRNWKPADFVAAGDFTMEAYGLECEPDILGTISRDGNTITAVIPTPAESFHQEILEQELIYQFDDAGNVKEITLNYQFVTGEKETEIHLEVKDTAREAVREIIDSQ